MATKKAILEAYEVISANAPLIRAENDHAYRILIHSWDMALSDISDSQLAVGVQRFLCEVTEVNRSMVISAKLRELCLPMDIPFNDYIVPKVVGSMIDARHNREEMTKVKAVTDPVLWNVIMEYPLDAIATSDMAQLPTIYAQIRNDYRLRHQCSQALKHNEKLAALQQKKEFLMEFGKRPEFQKFPTD